MRFAYARGKAIDEAAESISRRLPMVAYGLGFNGPAHIPHEARVEMQHALRACFGHLLSTGPFRWEPPVNTLEISYLGIERTQRGTVERNVPSRIPAPSGLRSWRCCAVRHAAASLFPLPDALR